MIIRLNRLHSYCILVLLWLGIGLVAAQDQDLIGGVQVDTGTSVPGYILFSPVGLTETYLIDKQGHVVNAWDSDYTPASAMYLTDEGHLIRAGRRGRGETSQRVIEAWDWDGNLVWQYVFESPRFTLHHDIQPMPNGNILVLAWEFMPIEEALELGFVIDGLETDEAIEEIRLDSIFEINPQTDAIDWEWHVRDHLVQDVNPDVPNYGEIADHPRRINLNFHDVPQLDDITHMNSIAYHATRDEIIVSARSFSEIWVIDHNITTEEAQGEAGDLLFRWGNPQAYGQGTPDDRTLYFQHDARWLDIQDADSALTVFNNGSRDYDVTQSQVIHFAFPDEWMADDHTFNAPEVLWQSTGDFFAVNMSGGQILSKGHVLMTLAPDGRFVEITPDSEIVWDYINPVYREDEEQITNRVFRATFYASDFVGFLDKRLQSQGELQSGIRQ